MLEAHEKTPVFITVDIAEDVVKSVVRKLSGRAGPGGMDSGYLQGWILKFGDHKIVLVWNILWTGYPIGAQNGPPIKHLCQAT